MTHASAWSAYWHGAGTEGCLPGAPAEVADMLRDGWLAFGAGLAGDARVLDLATGNGAVLRALRSVRPELRATGVDSATLPPAARAAGLVGGVDCAALPFEDAAFDAVTSQFGIEYCPAAALAEAVRVLRPGGCMRLVVHDAAGAAVTHNRGRGAALHALRDAGLFALARRVAAGLGEDAAVAAAVARARAVHRSQTVVEELPSALGRALRSTAPWPAIGAIEAQATGELARLEAMQAAALDVDGIDRMRAALGAAGLDATVGQAVAPRSGRIGWVVEGAR